MGFLEFGRAAIEKGKRFAYEQEQKRQAQMDNARARESRELENLRLQAKAARIEEKRFDERARLQKDIERLKRKRIGTQSQQPQGYGLQAVFARR